MGPACWTNSFSAACNKGLSRHHRPSALVCLPPCLCGCSRNTNSDSRKLLQLKRSLCLPPYSGFSTGSISTLWEEPNAAGVSVPGMLRQLWGACYTAEATTLAVVGPQETQELLQLVQEAFGSMRQRQDSSSGSTAGALGIAAEAAGIAAGVSDIESDRSSGSDSSADEASDSEAVGAAAAVPAPEAAVHAKAQQEGQPDQAAGVGSDVCSQIAAPQHHSQHHLQQHNGHCQPQVDVDQLAKHQQQTQQGRPRYPVDVYSAGAGGQLVRVCPQRDLRELQVLWYIPTGAMTHSRWAQGMGV